VEFLVRGAMNYGEPGVLLAFEEEAPDISQNVASLGFCVDQLIADKKLHIDHIALDDSHLSAAGDYDLDGLFIRLGVAIDKVGAKRVVLDTIETLFAAMGDEAILRAEMRRLLVWLKAKGVTTIITAERGERTLTRHGIEEYVSDCVIVLDHRVVEQMSTRRLRVLKYRGSMHGCNEYPFLIGENGISLLPITSSGLDHVASTARVSSGIPKLDEMMGGQGYFHGSSVLITGNAGIGKTSFAACFVDAACRRGERCLSFLFDESPGQLARNMRSIGIDLAPHIEQDLLRFHATRPSFHTLEMHLAVMQKMIADYGPHNVVIDPISSFSELGNEIEIRATLVRLIDFLKVKGITTLLTSLSRPDKGLERTKEKISSLIDTWLTLCDIELNGERNRGLYLLKSRGMAHSNQIREFVLTNRGVEIISAYVGPGGVLTGSSRLAQEAREKAEQLVARQEIERQQQTLERKRQAVNAKIAALQAEFAADEAEFMRVITQEQAREKRLIEDRQEMGQKRGRSSGAGVETL
jgi:circadian clock protein KaiC